MLNTVALVLLSVAAQDIGEPISVEQYDLIQQTNEQRVRSGLPELEVDLQLMHSAQAHAEWMAQARSLQHSGGVAENIAMGYPDVVAAMQGWMNSQGHRRNILDGSYRLLGVGMARSADGRCWWVQQFSSRGTTSRTVRQQPSAALQSRLFPRLFQRPRLFRRR